MPLSAIMFQQRLRSTQSMASNELACCHPRWLAVHHHRSTMGQRQMWRLELCAAGRLAGMA
jgi:hypothetical protein